MSNVSRGADLERRTVAALVAAGWRAERVSRQGRNNGGDAFGCVDVLAISPEGEIELIQVTTKGARSARRRKIRAARLTCPVRLIYWFKNGARWAFLSEVVEGSDGTAS
jgi:Holliday junction resolvase